MMNETTQQRDDFIKALEHLVKAKSQDRTKGKKVSEWFANYFDGDGRASYITESKQINNRVVEQFKHLSAHVVFVQKDGVSLKKIIEVINDETYDVLETALIVSYSGSQFIPTNLLCREASEIKDFYLDHFPDLKIEKLPGKTEVLYTEWKSNTIEVDASSERAEQEFLVILSENDLGVGDQIVLTQSFNAQLVTGKKVIFLQKSLDYGVNAVWSVTDVAKENSSTDIRVSLKKIVSAQNTIGVEQLLENGVLPSDLVSELNAILKGGE